MLILTDFENKVKEDLFVLIAVAKFAQSRAFLYPRKLPVSKANVKNRKTYNLYSIKYQFGSYLSCYHWKRLFQMLEEKRN